MLNFFHFKILNSRLNIKKFNLFALKTYKELEWIKFYSGDRQSIGILFKVLVEQCVIYCNSGKVGQFGKEGEIFFSKTIWLFKRIRIKHPSDVRAADQR
jgi:hypothetical protein